MERKNGSNDIARISHLIHNLLSHYWIGNEPVQISDALIQDWLDDLSEFGPAIVEGACQRWRRQAGGRRPTPGDIRQMCIEERRDYSRDGIHALPAPDERDRIEQIRAERRAEKEALYRRAAEWRMSRRGQACLGDQCYTAASLGVTAREYSPTGEQMAAGRRALGLDAEERP